MPAEYNLERFIKAQQSDYPVALEEIKNGRKKTHWMWYIFPQIVGLGFSEASMYYAIHDIGEASAYLQHPVLGRRLETICEALLVLKNNNATSVFGKPDDMKLKSSLTLFASVPGAGPVFEDVLEKYFNGDMDTVTLKLIGKE
jgi:uncharacterized protein (DUF1810 family)